MSKYKITGIIYIHIGMTGESNVIHENFLTKQGVFTAPGAVKTKSNGSGEKTNTMAMEVDTLITKAFCLLFSRVRVPLGQLEVQKRGMSVYGFCV